MCDVFAIYDNNISPSLLMIILKIIILYFIQFQIRHTDNFPPTSTPASPSNSSTVFGKVGYYEHRPGGSTLKNVLIIPSANMLIIATVMCMPLNDNNLEL